MTQLSHKLCYILFKPNPDIENTMIAQVLDTLRKLQKSQTTNEVYLAFWSFLCTSVTYTLKHISISGFGCNYSAANIEAS